MGRWLSIVLGLLVLCLPFLLPDAPTARLAARNAGKLVTAPLDPEVTDSPTLFDEFSAHFGDTLPLAGFRFDAEEGAGGEFEDTFEARTSLVRHLRSAAGESPLVVLGELGPEREGLTGHVRFTDGDLVGRFEAPDGTVFERTTTASIPKSSSLWPPLVAVALAILFRRPILALAAAVLVGAFLVNAELGFASASVAAVGDFFTVYLKDELVDSERSFIVGFVVFMLAMVGVLTKSGAIRGMMDAIAKRADSRRGTTISTYLMGLAIFFDDYANTILVGSTMRPLSDKYQVAREKLAYLVDSTAAPVAGLSIFSTWIAFEVSTFNAQLPAAGLEVSDGYAIFLQSIPFSFYCIFTLVFVGAIAFTGRDFGPMRKAELRAASGGGVLGPGAKPMVGDGATQMEPDPRATPRASHALLALGMFLIGTLFMIALGGGLFDDFGQLGSIEGITGVLFNGSGSEPLFYGSLAGLVVAIVCALVSKLDLGTILGAAGKTVLHMLVAFGILYLAWMIGAVTEDLDTAGYLTAFVGDKIPPYLLPTGLFFLSGLMAFATGSSWSTMSIVLPIAVPLAYQMGLSAELAEASIESGRLMMTMSIGSVLSGAIFGDHCSPISDTTVMSSIATASDHIDHVRTQAPYAIVCMLVSVGCGYLPAAMGYSSTLCLAFGVLTSLVLVFALGKKAEPA